MIEHPMNLYGVRSSWSPDPSLHLEPGLEVGCRHGGALLPAVGVLQVQALFVVHDLLLILRTRVGVYRHRLGRLEVDSRRGEAIEDLALVLALIIDRCQTRGLIA